MIELKNVSKNYRLYESPGDRLKEALHPFGKKYHSEFSALKNITLSVAENEIVGVVGKNGSGKSTLLKIIANVLQPSSGELVVRDKVTPLLELGSGLNPEYSGIDNIYFYGSILGLEREKIREVLEEIVDFADIGEHINQPLKTYSSGMKSRLGFSIAVHIEPKVLIVDEVLSVGDIAFQRKCYRRMEELFSAGSTVLYVSHNMQSVVQLCNRAVMVHHGELIMDDSPDKVVKEYQKLLFQEPSDQSGETAGAAHVADEPLAVGDADVKPTHHPEFYSGNLKAAPKLTNPEITRFTNVRLRDRDDLFVNQLTQGDEYTLSFTCEFERNVSDISFGCQFQTLDGVIISGANMLANQQELFPEAHKGDKIRVKCKFRCLLVPGAYVVKIFSAPEDGNPPSVSEDAMMFQVRAQKRQNGGYVYLEQHISAFKI